MNIEDATDGAEDPPRRAEAAGSAPKKRNCTNCRHLDVETWENAFGCDQWAYVCNRPADRSSKAEDKHLQQLSREAYREKAKRCCEPNT